MAAFYLIHKEDYSSLTKERAHADDLNALLKILSVMNSVMHDPKHARREGRLRCPAGGASIDRARRAELRPLFKASRTCADAAHYQAAACSLPALRVTFFCFIRLLRWLREAAASMSNSDRVVLVLGGAGMVGSGIVKGLLDKGKTTRGPRGMSWRVGGVHIS